MTPRECVTPYLANQYVLKCCDLQIWRFIVLHWIDRRRDDARLFVSQSDPRVVTAERRRERIESARRGMCEWLAGDCDSAFARMGAE